jgi:hypothetical protein
MNCCTRSLDQKRKLHILHNFLVWVKWKSVFVQGIRMRIGGVQVQLHSFLISTLGEGAWTASRTGRFMPENGHTKPIEQEPGWAPEPILTLWGYLLHLTRIEPRFLSRTARGGVVIVTGLSSNSTNRLTLASIRVAGKRNPLKNKNTAFCPDTVSV